MPLLMLFILFYSRFTYCDLTDDFLWVGNVPSRRWYSPSDRRSKLELKVTCYLTLVLHPKIGLPN